MKIKKRYVIAVIIILFLNVILINSSENDYKVNSEVYKVLEKQDEVKVVVEIKEPGAQKGVIKTDNQKELEKDIIKEDIKNNMEEDSLRHEFDNFISLEVSVEDLEKLKSNKNVVSISPVGRVEAFLQDSIPLINATRVWSLQINNSNLTGISETVCVLDTGINFSHSDLNGKNKTACLVDCLGGGCAQDCGIYDDHGHGTHVAGIVAASPFIYGVAMGVNLIGVKVLYADGSGDFDDVAAGIEWCVNNANLYNISVITMSLGTNCALNPELCYSSYCDSQPISSLAAPAIDNAVANNISVIIASGNNGNTQYISAPACIKNATAVGATGKSDSIWSGTNRNGLLDLLAPGVTINSTSKSGGYEIRTGTSMAAPHVAGAFAIISQLHKLQNNRDSTPFEIQNVLNITGRKINDGSGTGLNFSRIDVYSAVLYLDSIAPLVNLTFPLNNHFNSSNNMSFNCNGNDWQLSNVTFYLWNSSSLIYNETKNISGTSNTSVFVYNLENKNYKWNCLVKDLNGNFAFASSNNTLLINVIFMNLISPLNQTYIKINSSLINNTNFSCNSSRGEYGTLKNVTFYLWNSSNALIYNETRNITGVSNVSVFFYNLSVDDNYKWNCILYNNFSNFTLAENNNTVFYDLSNPVIPNVASSPSTTSATITFTTNENCNYSIEYGINTSLGTSINESNFSTSHSSSLSGLSASTTYYYNISYCDLVGNCLSNGTYSFTTLSSIENLGSGGGGGGGGGGGAIGNIPITYSLTSSEINYGAIKQIKEKDKIKFSIDNNSNHTIVLNNLTNSYVKITIFSNPINLTLFVGEEKKLNLTSYDYYDLYIRLNSIINNSASITVKNIHENIIKNNTEKIMNVTDEKKEYNVSNSSDNLKYTQLISIVAIIFIVIMIIITVIVVRILKTGKKPRKSKLEEYRKIFNKKVKIGSKKLPFIEIRKQK